MRSKERKSVPERDGALDALKYETARELGIQLPQSRGESMTARDAGRLGGNMVRKMIRDFKRDR